MEWIDDRLPQKSARPMSEHTAHFGDWVIIQQAESMTDDEKVTIGYLNTETGGWNTYGPDKPKVLRWMPLPEPK